MDSELECEECVNHIMPFGLDFQYRSIVSSSCF